MEKIILESMYLVTILFMAVTLCLITKELIVSRDGIQGQLLRNLINVSGYLRGWVAGFVTMIVGGYSHLVTVQTDWFPAILLSATLFVAGAFVVALTTFLADRKDDTNEIEVGG